MRTQLNSSLPPDAAARCSGRSYVAITRVEQGSPDLPVILDSFGNRESLIDAGAGSCCLCGACAFTRCLQLQSVGSKIREHKLSLLHIAHAKTTKLRTQNTQRTLSTQDAHTTPATHSRRLELPPLLVLPRPLDRPGAILCVRRRLHAAAALPAIRCAFGVHARMPRARQRMRCRLHA